MTLMKSNGLLPTLPRFFDDFMTRDLFDWGFHHNSATNTTLPSVNIVEDNDAFIVEMAAPGMDKKDFQIMLDNEVLTISSQRENAKEEDDRSYTRREFSYQSFRRSFHLPKSVVDDSKIKANYDNGLLRIMIPKKEEAKTLPAREIAIK